jgi:D-alanyl-D-alanine carboxypeptidase
MSAWREMKAAARAEGVELELISAYRSVERQRQIFLRELSLSSRQSTGREYDIRDIAAGQADPWIEEVLRFSSIPGFSKHHSGYTIDIADTSQGQAFTEFRHTPGFEWISARNYLNAKRFGFIPSYPDGADGQGPDPEPWEYVWVGREPLLIQPANGQ